jgi:cell volume regulation protein A
MDIESIIFLVSVTLFLSYISSLIYERTRVPDILWLMGLGLTVGPILHLFDKTMFLNLAPLMSIVALSVILFEAGINLDINVLLNCMRKSMALAVLSLISVMGVLGLMLSRLFPGEFTLFQGMLLGAMVGGTSTVSTYGVLAGLDKSVKNLESTRVLLTLESIVSDPLCIIASITLIRMIMLPEVSIVEGASTIVITFLFSSLFGLGAGLIWARILDRLKNGPSTYVITLAVLIPTYIIVDRFIGDGGGAMAALVFGLAVTNYSFIVNRLGFRSRVMVDKQRLREFHEEIAFFIKSFFFVYIGLIVSLSLNYLIVGVGLAALLMAIRYTLVSGLGGLLSFTVEERTVGKYVFAMGLPAFVMSQLPMVFDPAGSFFVNTSIYPNLCMPIVLGTVIYGALVAPYAVRRSLDSGFDRVIDQQLFDQEIVAEN